MANRSSFTTDELIVLRGAPLTILCALLLARREGQTPVNQKWIKQHTRYGLDTINDALHLLQERGYAIEVHRYAWLPADNARQLPLMSLLGEGEDTPDSDLIGVGQNQTTGPQAPDSDLIGVRPSGSQTREFLDSEKIGVQTVSGTIEVFLPPENSQNGLKKGPDSDLIGVQKKRGGGSGGIKSLNNLKDSPPPPQLEADPEYQANYAECKRYGIGNTDARKIARTPGVTPRLIRYHCTTAETIPRAIFRIKDVWGILPGWRDPDEAPEKAGDDPAEDPPPDEIPPAAPAISDPLAMQTWLSVLDQLTYSDMTRGAIESYVRPLAPLGLDPEGRFTLAAVNPYARDWCESRLSSTLARLLSGIYGQPVQPRFVLRYEAT